MDKSWMVLTDAGLSQYVGPDKALKIAFNSNSDTKALFPWIGLQIRSNRITKMYLLAHGISLTSKGPSVGMSMEANYSLPESVSGFGLSMGDTPVCIDNDYLFQAWRGCGLQTIVLPSCGIASGNNSGSWGDGRTMCQHIANYTGATVYASDTKQTIGVDWEGNLYRFKPNQSTGGQLLAKPYPAVTTRVDYD